MSVQLSPDAVIWSGPLEDKPLLVLLHGYGSNEADLAGLAPMLPDGLTIASVRAPIPAGAGFAWVPIVVPGQPDPGITQQSTDAVLQWLDERIPATQRVGLLGFSQGGLMVTQLFRARPERFVCGVVLSGFTLDRDQPNDAALAARKPPMFFGRGTEDRVITAEATARAARWLPGHSDLTEKIYPGLAHSISQPEIDDVNEFLGKHLR